MRREEELFAETAFRIKSPSDYAREIELRQGPTELPHEPRVIRFIPRLPIPMRRNGDAN